MPRRSRGPYLYLKPERRDSDGNLKQRSAWVIREGRREHSTGCLAGEVERAESALAEYIAAKHTANRRLADIEEIEIATVLLIYDEDKRPTMANQLTHDSRIKRLNDWWGGKMLAEVTGVTCRAYADFIGKPGQARRDLEDLRAAINHHAKEGLHRGHVRVWLPPKGEARERWLTRSEAARLLWACWRFRETQHRKTGTVVTRRKPLQHIARFILIGLYTGTRAASIATASPKRGPGRSYVDLDAGIFYRLPSGKKQTNKRQPPVPLPDHLLAHMRRWVRKGIANDYMVEYRGKPVQSVRKGFDHAVELAGLEEHASPHTLRHTAATWLMQAGVDKWEAAGFLGMTMEMLEKTYGHHHPDYLKGAASAMKTARKNRVVVGEIVGEGK